VINLSFGGERNPLQPSRDMYSVEEAEAIDYAVAHRVVVVAAVGNGDQAPREPWHFASYPAALPHVLGVSAFAEDGSVPDFSNRDAVYNDIAAPGERILSTLPRQITAQFPGCAEQGYSSCGPEDFRLAEGTSFAAPQASAAAAMLLSVDPSLSPDQVTTILERTATDANAGNGCRHCPLGRDAFSGWGRLNVAAAIAALAGPVPPTDTLEPNDDAGVSAWPLSGRTGSLHATVDFWDDQSDVYRLRVHRGQKLFVVLSGPTDTDTVLALWRPGTERVDDLRKQSMRLRVSARPGFVEKISYVARRTGFYYLQVKIQAGGAGRYTLQFSKTGS
jgi:subtilisin family serine protease